MSKHTPRDGQEVFIWDGQGAPMRGYWVAGLEKFSTEVGMKSLPEIETWVDRNHAKAAPDLLAACKLAQSAMGAHGPCKNHDCSECDRAWNALRAAIAKAVPQ